MKTRIDETYFFLFNINDEPVYQRRLQVGCHIRTCLYRHIEKMRKDIYRSYQKSSEKSLGTRNLPRNSWKFPEVFKIFLVLNS